ncbi:MAG: HAD family hydrolase [Clostridiales bacterium]|nr:HAD family hydrolase [Clostridiales bacterium]
MTIPPKTLYVTDLDGTLLRSDKTLSGYTEKTVNSLVEEGMAITYASARSVLTAREVAGGLKLRLPVITRNGTVFADHGTGRMLEKALFAPEEISKLKEILPDIGCRGNTTRYVEDKMQTLYIPGEHVPGMEEYLKDRKDDPRLFAVKTTEEMFEGEIGYISMLDDRDVLYPVYERLRSETSLECVFQKDTYVKEYWLEICPENSTKAKAILKLKKKLGFDKLVVFGDSVNDLPMFEIADEAYAVSNAIKEVRDKATGILGSNDEDSVARFLLKERM